MKMGEFEKFLREDTSTLYRYFEDGEEEALIEYLETPPDPYDLEFGKLKYK